MCGYVPRDRTKEIKMEQEILAKYAVSDPRLANYRISVFVSSTITHYARSLKGARAIACLYIMQWGHIYDDVCDVYITYKDKKTGTFGQVASDIVYFDKDYGGYVSQKYNVPIDQAYFNRVEICPKTGATLRKIPPKYKVEMPYVGGSKPLTFYYPTKDLARKCALKDMVYYAQIEKCESGGKYMVLEQLWRGDKGEYFIHTKGKTYTISRRTGKFLKKVE